LNPYLAEVPIDQQQVHDGPTTRSETTRHDLRRKAMYRVHRLATGIAGLIVSIIGVIAAAPAAFATLEPDPGESGQYVPPATITHTGLNAWQVTLIALVAAVAAALLTAVVLKVRTRTEGVRPAAS
jgi:hypothetical protein